jgi:hypothetical protein
MEVEMAEQNVQWEYRVITLGNAFSGAKDEQIEMTLNEWGTDGWEAVNVYAPTNSPKVTLVAKRLMTSTTRRMRSMP